MILPRSIMGRDPLSWAGSGLISDRGLDATARAHLAEFTTPRRMGGRLYWLADEVGHG